MAQRHREIGIRVAIGAGTSGVIRLLMGEGIRLVGLGIGIAAFLRNSDESVPLLMQRMAQIVEDARAILPEGLRQYVPENTATLQTTIAEWLRSNASALQLAGVGIVIGVAGAVAMRQIVASQLYETSALDPWVLALVPLTMLAVTLLASYVPARRASRIDVTAALREN